MSSALCRLRAFKRVNFAPICRSNQPSRSCIRPFASQSISRINQSTPSQASNDEFIENETTDQSNDLAHKPKSINQTSDQSQIEPSHSQSNQQSSNQSDSQSRNVIWTALARDRRRHFFEPWQFRQYARTDDMTAALIMLEAEGKAIVIKQVTERAADDARKLEEAKKLNPRMRVKRKPSATQINNQTNPDTLTCLAAHPYSTYAQLARAFASHGRAQSVMRLINRLQQITRTIGNDSLAPRADIIGMAITAFALSDNYPQNAILEHFNKHSKHTSSRPSNQPLFDLKSHHTVFDLLAATKCSPTLELFHSLQLLHAQHGNAQSLIADLAMLHANKYAPKIEVYVDAITQFGLTMNDSNAALAIFLHLTELFLPSSSAFNAMIAVLAHHGQFAMAQQLVRDMREQRQHPDASTYASLVRALANSGRMSKAWQMYDWVRQVERPNIERALLRAMKSDLHITMINIARAAGNWSDVKRVWTDAQTDEIQIEARIASAFGQAALELDQRSEARAAIQLLCGMDKLDPRALQLSLEVLAWEHEYEAARALFDRYAEQQRMQDRGVNPAVLTALLSTVKPEDVATLFDVLRAHLEHDVMPQRIFMTQWLALLTDADAKLARSAQALRWSSSDVRVAQRAIRDIAQLYTAAGDKQQNTTTA